MIELDDPIWSDLQHSYGVATDVPSMIRMAESNDNLDFWHELSNRLVHQCCVSDAAIAAFPHFVLIASKNLERNKGVLAINLAGWILVLALQKNKWFRDLPSSITSPFREHVRTGRAVAAEIYKNRPAVELSEEFDFLATLAAFDENVEAYGLLATWHSGELGCPHCDQPITLEDISPY